LEREKRGTPSPRVNSNSLIPKSFHVLAVRLIIENRDFASFLHGINETQHVIQKTLVTSQYSVTDSFHVICKFLFQSERPDCKRSVRPFFILFPFYLVWRNSRPVKTHGSGFRNNVTQAETGLMWGAGPISLTHE